MDYEYKKSKLILAAGLLGASLLFAGCGNSLDDQFVFGRNRIHCDNQTITVSTPFELVSNGKQVDLGDKGASVVKAEGHNSHLQILVTGEKVTADMNEKVLISQARNVLKSNSSLSNVKFDSQDVKIGNLDGKKLTFTFTETSRGKSTDLTVDEYILPRRIRYGGSFTSTAPPIPSERPWLKEWLGKSPWEASSEIISFKAPGKCFRFPKGCWRQRGLVTLTL